MVYIWIINNNNVGLMMNNDYLCGWYLYIFYIIIMT